MTAPQVTLTHQSMKQASDKTSYKTPQPNSITAPPFCIQCREKTQPIHRRLAYWYTQDDSADIMTHAHIRFITISDPTVQPNTDTGRHLSVVVDNSCQSHTIWIKLQQIQHSSVHHMHWFVSRHNSCWNKTSTYHGQQPRPIPKYPRKVASTTKMQTRKTHCYIT